MRVAPVCLVAIVVVFAATSLSPPHSTVRTGEFRAETVQEDQQRTGQDKQSSKPAQKAKPKKGKQDKPTPPKTGPLAQFMRQKLEASNMILEGLVVDDLKLINKGSERLTRISNAEQWRITNDPTYGRFSREFRGTLTKLKEKSKKGSLDGAALAWMDVTLSCIECHEWVRNTIIADRSELRFPAQ